MEQLKTRMLLQAHHVILCRGCCRSCTVDSCSRNVYGCGPSSIAIKSCRIRSICFCPAHPSVIAKLLTFWTLGERSFPCVVTNCRVSLIFEPTQLCTALVYSPRRCERLKIFLKPTRAGEAAILLRLQSVLGGQSSAVQERCIAFRVSQGSVGQLGVQRSEILTSS
jgi:hypothetical protein